MQYVNLGASGLKVSRIALGMMTFGSAQWRPWVKDEAAARQVVRRALELGINVFDTADMYSAGASEEITGRLLKELAPRDEIVIATKVYFPVDLAFKGGNAAGPKPPKRPNMSGLSRKRVFAAVDASLRRLGTDYIDLYQIHRFDAETPVEETMEALHDVVKSGRVRYLGASSMWAWQFARMQFAAERHGWTRFASMQNHYNLAYREEEREMIPFCIDQGIGIIPWSPLARGFLAGNRVQDKKADVTLRSRTDDFAHNLYYTDADFTIAERAKEVAARLGVKPAQIALAWMLHKPGITSPIIGASKMYQLEEAVAALDIRLSEADITALEEVYQPKGVLGHS